MANRIVRGSSAIPLEILVLSKREAAEVIAFLGSQLADTCIPGNAVGAAPVVRVVHKGAIVREIALCLEGDKKGSTGSVPPLGSDTPQED